MVEQVFGKIIQRLRNQRGMTRSELADLTDSNPSTILKIEAGTNSPSMFFVFKLASALRLKPNELIHVLENEMNPNCVTQE
jgi:transcriptional regulator with XRE-family HTH domain